MKKVFLLLTILFVGWNYSFVNAQPEEKIFSDIIEGFFKTKNIETRTLFSNQITQLASLDMEEEWPKFYYGALTKIIISHSLTDSLQARDNLLLAWDMLNSKDMEKIKDERLLGEIKVLEALWNCGQMVHASSPKSKSEYQKEALKKLEEAGKINPNNPRYLFANGWLTYYATQKSKKDKEKALKYFEAARDRFVPEQKGSIFVPYWGFDINEYYIYLCKKQ